ncbi:MAG: sigma-54-dependent Fis family transcriptional regulator, partial [Mesoflavibacter sp.]|nr:sigma-54-dependent Fis family transcriptional regulator [Mesoflavibacter sp.]
LQRKGHQIGAIYMDSRANRGRFNQESLAFLAAFGHQAAIAIENARLYEALMNENAQLHQEVERLSGFAEMIGQSPQMQKVFELIKKVTPVDTTILIEGESGTGKELVARAIHFNGPRKSRPFVAQFCGALSEHLLESELFGYKKGSFTGVVGNQSGRTTKKKVISKYHI